MYTLNDNDFHCQMIYEKVLFKIHMTYIRKPLIPIGRRL
ncbi:hypothetical protein [Bacillus altitudinis]|nr:hypothetical protein [Bacillus altitudinis]